MKRSVLALACVLSLAAAGASPANAEPRYAAPAGEGAACTESQPCPLEEAVTKAKSGDEVIVTAGSYTLSKSLKTPLGVENLDIHGAVGGAMPTIASSTSLDYALDLRGAGGRLSYLAVEDTAPTFAWAVKCLNGGRVERVRISATGNPAIGLLQGEDCAVRDSLIVAEGKNAQAILATGGNGVHTGLARNVTAVGTGSESIGITSSYSATGAFFGSYFLDAKNVIASGDAWDLNTAGGEYGVGHFQISNSNFDTTRLDPASTLAGAANQTAPPLFVDAAGGDYRQAAGSPTIDAGVADQLGAVDLDGSPRVQGAAPDIGAFEFPSIATAGTPTAPPVARLESLRVAPSRFRPLKGGQAIANAVKAPRGTTVTYRLNVSSTVGFRVERMVRGRRVKGKCVRQTRANRTNKACPLFKAVRGPFSHLGAAGENRFGFSGRLGGRALKPGAYRLRGETGTTIRYAGFRIVK